MSTTEEACLEALRAAAEELGESPTKAQYEELGVRPSSTTILRVVGGWNLAKERAGLETYTQKEGGGVDVQPKPRDLSLPDGYQWEALTPQQRWYYKNRDYRMVVKDRRVEELREWFYEYKLEQVSCIRCEEGNPYAVDFHHTGGKDRMVSKMITHGYSKERILQEVRRCTPLCANCHRREHYQGPHPRTLPDVSELEVGIDELPKYEKRARLREWLLARKYASDGCRCCDTTHPICLDFHHEDRKRRGVSELVSFGPSLAELRSEIRRCSILCANCHRIEHLDGGD